MSASRPLNRRTNKWQGVERAGSPCVEDELPLLSQIYVRRSAHQCVAEARLARQSQAVIIRQVETELGIELAADQSCIRWRKRQNDAAYEPDGARRLSDSVAVNKRL